MSNIIISLDLEFNSAKPPLRGMPSRKIIQIGAVLCSLESGAELRWFSCFVNPREPLPPRITRLTGIQQSDVDTAPGINDAYQQLVAWLAMWHVDRPATALTWGAPDTEILQEAIGLGSGNERWCFGRYIDAKDSYIAWCTEQHPWLAQFMKALGLQRPWIGGLSRCVKTLGLTFQGRPHNALDDAINAFLVYYAVRERERQT